MNPADLVVSGADQLAAKGDRWAFFAVLILFFVVMYFVARYFMQNHKQLITDHRNDRARYEENMTMILREQNEQGKQLVVCLDRNTTVLERNTVAMENCTHELRRCREER